MTTPLLGLPEIAASQSQKHVTHNEALGVLDALVQLSVLSQSQPSAPGSPADGDRYIVPTEATGDFAGQDGAIASHREGTWSFFAPQAGWRAYVADEGGCAVFNGTSWTGPGVVTLASTLNGAESRIVTVEEELILSGASVASSVVIPDRAIVFCVSTRTTEEVTGVWNYHCGIAGEAEKFGGFLGIAAGSTNAGVIGPQAFYADTPVVLTANGDTGAFTGGKVRVALHYLLPIAPEN
ncbi:DUF2793 domain-containing protein [Roseibium polysiphoniae]|uniref:DUF2793 domain-containing protein n=1 Tax=Roseibium polysiphoniae TaxID=2571221 RepID=A0ABR9C692_9HYPH|nr:DUF2793 domain-containing protein [Roseibium polysiphoniae]MBD8875446.1 DUF2793 domain-containing protein [Roseibium polysiphoniae]